MSVINKTSRYHTTFDGEMNFVVLPFQLRYCTLATSIVDVVCTSPWVLPNWFAHKGTPGGTDLERGYGNVRPWRPPFHASPAARKGPISSKRVSSQDPLLRKFGNFSLYSLNFHPSFSSQAPKFGNFPLTSPPFQRQMSVRKPHTSEVRATHPYLKKKLSAHRGPPVLPLEL